MAVPDLVIIIDDSNSDFYAGSYAAIYVNGERKWADYSNDAIEAIADALLGDDRFTLLRLPTGVTPPVIWPWVRGFPETITELPVPVPAY